MQTFRTHSPGETHALGVALAHAVQLGQVIALVGDLGAGKTTFVQGLAAGLGVRGRVASPTFMLANEHRTPSGLRLLHIDTYRLGDAAAEASGFGLEEIVDDATAIVAIEWADRIASLLPADHLRIEFILAPDDEDVRELRVCASGPTSALALEKLAAAWAR